MTLVLLQCTVLKMFSLFEKSCSPSEEMRPFLGSILCRFTPKCKVKTRGALSVAAPKLCNNLPHHFKMFLSFEAFKSHVNTHFLLLGF